MTFNSRELAAEFLGSAILIFVGCASVAIAGLGPALPLASLPIGLAFGLTVIALAYSLGPISGCHINPSATVGLWLAGRFPSGKVAPYVIAQIVGGVCGALCLIIVLKGRAGGYDIAASGLGQNGWGEGYLGQYDTASAFVSEGLTSFILMAVILFSTHAKATPGFAPLAIGIVVTVIILAFINVTGVSMNPMRSLAPAVFVGGRAIEQLWLFMIAPTMGMAVAAISYRWLTK
jgi:aquaporin Z